MGNSAAEAGQFLTFFQINPAQGFQGKFPETLARIHGLILIATRQAGNFLSEEFLEEEEFLASYLSILNENRENSPGASHQQSILDFILSTLGSNYDLATDASQHVILSISGDTYSLFPFFINHAGSIYWLLSCRPGIFTYTDASGDILAIHYSHPSFQDVIDGFTTSGCYRAVLRGLSEIPDHYRKIFENRIYSAHCFLACEYYKLGRYHEAIADFEKALSLRSNMPQLFYNLALSYARIKSYKNAIHLLNQLNRIKPNQARTFELLGDFYGQLGDWERALALYQKTANLTENRLSILPKIKRAEERLPKLKTVEPRKEKEEEKEDKFSIQTCLQDLTLDAELGQMPPVIGRDPALLQMQEILACHAKKNVLILGDPGVGKTALINEFAYRMIAGKVSRRFQNKKLVRLNIGTILAGAKFRGQLEERLMQLIREIKKLNCILFVDDIHQIVSGSSGKASATEASQFLKPALMNDEIQIIGATSLEEFRNSIEKDISFLRCFQLVKLEEPDHDTLIRILRAYRSRLENFHHVIIQEECLETVLMWVKVLLRDRALPDKALDILDRTAARVSIQDKSTVVTSENVLETISEISGVPVSKMSVSETAHYRNMEHFLSHRVVGQTDAIGTVSRVLCTSKLQMSLNPVRPKGIFLFVGPTGVGKTELAKAMADFLFGDREKIIRIDMSEYMERYSASRLIGTSPGYVGYYDQNQLVDKIRSSPYSLILLDEIEKADAQLLNIFLQVFDAGRLTDGKGKTAYFDNATIVMTSNIGTHLFAQNRMGYGPEQADHVTRSDLMKEVKRFFQPEFLNRIDEIVFFKPLAIESVKEIAALKLESIFEQLKRQEKELQIEDAAMTELSRIGYDYEYGARNLERVLRRQLLDRIAEMALTEDWRSVHKIIARWSDGRIVLSVPGSSGLQEVISPPLEAQDYLEE